jgi:Tol biopolymer transport system component
VRGGAVDQRSDIFALGAVLYEMLGGQRPFRGDTAVETMNAILKEDPPDLRIGDASMAPALSRIVRHCLEKEPAERFQSARDLAFNLEAVRSGSDASGAVRPTARPRRRFQVPAVAALCALSLLAGAAAGWAFLTGPEPAASPVFTRLTNEKGTIWFARFTPDGQSVIYSASWDGKPIRSFLTRADRLGATPLALPDGAVLAVSATGELAIGLGQRFDGWMGRGTLARGPMFGAAPRAIAEQVREADWLPDGSDLAVVRRVDGRERLELPIGNVLFDTSGYISHIRVSKDGARVAFANHPFFADDNGDVAVVDRAGKLTTLVGGLQGLRGIAWSPRGDEVWFTANSTPHAGDTLRAVTLDGRQRVLLTVPTESKLLDVASDGRLLFAGESDIRRIELFAKGAAQPRDLALFTQSMGSMIAPDGRSGLITDQGSVAGTAYATYYWRADRDDIVRLGEGQAADLSPDGRYALSIVSGPPSRLLIQPTGAGEGRTLPNPDDLTIQAARFLHDGARVFLIGGKGTGASRGWVQTIATGAIVPVTDTGVDASAFWNTMPISPDGRFVALVAKDGAAMAYPVAGGAPEPLHGFEAGEFPLEWTPDGREMYVAAGASIPNRIVVVDPVTGERRPWKEITASQPAGVRLSQVLLTPDGSAYVHTYAQLLSTLFVASGVHGR